MSTRHIQECAIKGLSLDLLKGIVGNGANFGHLFQMLGGVVGMDHTVGGTHVVSSKDVNGFSTGMVKACQVVNVSIDANLVRFEVVQGAESLSGGIIDIRIVLSSDGTALTNLACVRRHCFFVSACRLGFLCLLRVVVAYSATSQRRFGLENVCADFVESGMSYVTV